MVIPAALELLVRPQGPSERSRRPLERQDVHEPLAYAPSVSPAFVDELVSGKRKMIES